MRKVTSFDWIAPVYDALARLVFGRRLQQAQRWLLDRIPPEASVLVVGGGTGWLLEPLLRQCRPARVLYLEPSARMLARASERMLRQALTGTVTFQLGDERDLPPQPAFDVVLTPFVLDLFTEQTLRQRVIPALRSQLRPGGQWLIADFVPTHVGWQRALLWLMIRFFRLTAGIEARQLANWSACLAEAGLLRHDRKPFVGGMVSAEGWEWPVRADATAPGAS